MAILQNKFVREDGSIIGSSVIISCKYTSDVNSQTNLTVGDTTAAEVDVEIRNPAKEIATGEKLAYHQIEDGVENLVGIFYTEAPTVATKTSIHFKAYDSKAKLAVDFSEWLNNHQDDFPMTVRSLGNAACEAAGLVLAEDSFQFENLSIPAFYAQGVTCRQIIGWIAQLNGSFVACNTAGEIFFDWYRETDISIEKSNFSQDGLSRKTYSTELIQRVQFKQEANDVGIIYPADAEGNVLSISQNGIAALLDSGTLRTIAQYLYNKLKAVTYTPLSVKLPKRTAKIKAGDIVSVTDGNGETVKTYVMKVCLDSSGTQISSTGDQNYADKAAVSSEQYKNIPGKVLLLEKSVDGLRIENADMQGNLTEIQQSIEGVKITVSSADQKADNAQSTADSAQSAADSAQTGVEQNTDRIVKAETVIQQLSNCISMLVTDGNGQSLMTQVQDGWTFNMQQTNDAVSSLSDSLANLQSTTGNVQLTVDTLQKTLADHGQTLEYVNISTYEGEPCIELGESDSEFKLRITNTRILFLSGSNIPTYINTNGLVTQNIEITENITQGGYVMTNTSDGGWALIWKG